MVDTGASITTVDKKYLRRQRHLPHRRIRVQTAGGFSYADVYREQQLSLENIKTYNIDIAAMDLSDLSVSDGLLGMNYLRNFDFYIDQDSSILYLHAKKIDP